MGEENAEKLNAGRSDRDLPKLALATDWHGRRQKLKR
jgi:hypothetical protein